MANIRNYLEDYQDKSFQDVPLNELDVALLTEITYLPLDAHVSKKYLQAHGVALNELLEDFDRPVKAVLDNPYLVMPIRIHLLKALASARRFQNVRVSYFVNRQLEGGQFTAATYYLGDQVLLAFRGTDDTLHNWTESASLLYSAGIPSQKVASEYVNDLLLDEGQRLLLAGHSKGGNLAAYSLAHCKADIYEAIEAAFMFDGPELPESLYLAEEETKRLKTKLYRYTPQDSLFSYHQQPVRETYFIDASETALSKHLLTSWYVQGTNFVKLTHNSRNGEAVARAFNRWYNHVDKNDLEESLKILEELFQEVGMTSFTQLIRHPLRYGFRIYRAYQALPTPFKNKIRQNRLLFNAFYKQAYLNKDYHQSRAKEDPREQFVRFFL